MMYFSIPDPIDQSSLSSELMVMTEPSQAWNSFNEKAECQSQSGSQTSLADHDDNDPEGMEHDVGTFWNQALEQLKWSCLNCNRSVMDWQLGLQRIQRAAKLDQRIKDAALAIHDYGAIDMKLYQAWTGQTVVKPGAMPPPPASQHDVHTWPMDDVLIYDHRKWQLFVGSLGCPIRLDKMQAKPDIVIAMNGDDRGRPYEPWDWYEHLAETHGTAHLRYGGWDQTHANAFDAEQRSNEFKSVWRRLISDFRQILLCWHGEDDEFSQSQRQSAKDKHREDDEFCQSQRQSAKGKMIGKHGSKGKDKNEGKGKGKAMSKGYPQRFNVSPKGSFGKSHFNVFGKSPSKFIKGRPVSSMKSEVAGLSILPGDRRQSASGLKVADESFPGELANALAMLETMRFGRDVWKTGNIRPIRVLVHCYGGINRTCAAFCVLVMAFASCTMEKAIALWIKKRAYYAPFQNREYMIEALLEMQEELHTYRQ